MARPCGVCAHPDVDAINDTKASGEVSIRSLAAEHGLSASALSRHFRAGHARARSAALSAAPAQVLDSESVDVARELRALRVKAYAILRRAEASDRMQTALAAVREARAVLETIARLEGELADRLTIVQITTSPQWVQIAAAIESALRPYPDARRAVAARLRAALPEGGGLELPALAAKAAE